jgi:hypothetical protein
MDKLPYPDMDMPVCIVLCHTDLVPQNIFIDAQLGAIMGALGWDLV